ncbi:MAG: GH92 family glycosyl hydrolase [Marinilabiliaceae bacterium]|nr:GH92 family glycosyl hydrolase [Marinilabiliaceae bacterium]
MKRLMQLMVPVCLLLTACGSGQFNKQGIDILSYVDPLIGTGGHGHTYPGVTRPFGMVQVGPSNYSKGWDWCSGYHYSDTVLQGFAHTHLSGTGLSGLGDILIMPTSGKLFLVPGTDEFPDEGYSSRWSHKREKASPGVYQVYLDDYDIDVEVTCTKRTGLHRYTFNRASEHNIIIDPTHRIDEKLLNTEVEILSDTEIRGFKHSKGNGGDRKVYFYARFSKPFQNSGVAVEGNRTEGRKASSQASSAFVQYHSKAGEQVEVKIGLSFVSYEGAYKNYQAEAGDKDFDTVLQEAQEVWEHHLGKVVVEDDNEINKRIFYTALYHSLLVPNLINDVDGNYVVEGKQYQGESNQYSTYSTWDTFRAQNPLLTILEPAYVSEIVNSLISRQTVAKVGLPIWELTGHDNGCMPSYTPVSVVVDAVRKGIPGIDAEEAYEAIRATSMMDWKHSAFVSEPVVPWIKKLNYVPAHVWESCAQTIEYAYQDWCIYRLAKDLNKADTSYYLNRSKSYRNLFNEDIGYIAPKDSLGNWVPIDLNKWEGIRPHYITGNIWGYSTFVPHEIENIIELKGGPEKFCNWLDEIISDTTEIEGDAHVDINGFIGRYGHGDEPSHHIPYLYNYAGQPWKTQELVRRVMNTFYSDQPDGLINNEDCGQMSSWYIMGALGFYSFCPGDNRYTLSSPFFKKVTLHLDNGKNTVITTENKVDKIYIKSLHINGQVYNKNIISHQMLTEGVNLNYKLSDQPNRNWGIRD